VTIITARCPYYGFHWRQEDWAMWKRVPCLNVGLEKLTRVSIALLGLVACLGEGPSVAHDVWSNGGQVPSWVKAACCGPEDVHHLKPEDVQIVEHDGHQWWRIAGYHADLPYDRALPSQDGDYWIFYRDNDGTFQSPVYCFFAPMAM
jgi:hypothetical protein